MSTDSITETIAHFIGFFHTTLEQPRMRESYEKFLAQKSAQLEFEQVPIVQTPFDARFDLIGYTPDLDYTPQPAPLEKVYAWSNVTFAPPVIPEMDMQIAAYPGWVVPDFSAPGAVARIVTILPDIEPLGSVVNYLVQKISLSDNDYFGVGGHKLAFTPAAIDNDALIDFADDALSISPIANPDLPGTTDELIDFINLAIAELECFSADNAPEGATVSVARAETLEGNFLNGVATTDDLPNLDDYYDIDPDEDEGDVETGNAIIHADGTVTIEASVTVESGGNTLLNIANVTSFWTAATVTAVMGDHIELNAIIQINAWMEFDAITDTIDDWTNGDAPNQAFNLASFSRFDSGGEAEGEEGGGAEPTFPKHWVVERIDGDVMIVNWLQQFVFMSDNDTGILSSSGVTTQVVSGDNMAVNQINLFEMAFGYDLIVIGGRVFDANIIQQMNVLFDNDLIGAVDGFSTTGEGTVSTSGNLLWNEASIYNVGGAHRFDAMPDAYRAFAESLAAGGNGAAGNVLLDPAFAGLGSVKVLYISGDLIKLNYISQTNILGDSDQIALAMEAIGPVEGATWTFDTGSNNLINLASISDLDSLGTTYVSGEQYSQEILIQAEFISASPDDLGAQDPNALVNEAVAFLTDDAAGDAYGASQGGDPAYHPQDAGQGDGLQTMLT